MSHRASYPALCSRRAFPLLLALALAVPAFVAPRAHAHGDVRGMLAPSAYGGAWMFGSLDWWDTKSEMYAGSTSVTDARERSVRDVYYSTGAYHGVGPNTLVGIYVPYDAFSRLEHGVVMATNKGLGPTQLIVQQRVLRHDGTRSRSEIAVAARGFFVSPDDEEFPQWKPTNYRLAVGAQRFGWRALSTLSVGYTGAGYDAAFPANWTVNGSYAVRPWTSLLGSGRDFSIGIETNYRAAVNGKAHRVLAGPMAEVYPIPSLAVAASYGIPVYDKVTPQGLGGGSSLWLSMYWLY